MKNFNFGENLRSIRSAKGLSQEYMALALKISQTSYSRIERNKTIPLNHSPVKIALALGEPVADLLPLGFEPELVVSNTPVKFSEKAFAKTKTGLFVLLCTVILFGEFSYQVSYGICEAIGTSDDTLITVRWIASLTTVFAMLYWIKRLRS